MTADLDAILEGLETAVAHKRYGGQMLFFKPYPKQKHFLDLGATKRERVLFAGNRNGKSHTAAFEGACHATGLYPQWWAGKRFTRATRGWICGESGELVRDVAQVKLFGKPGIEEAWGTGMIPRDKLIGKSTSHGAAGLLDTVQVRHVSGGVSTISSKSYEQGRTKFQGESCDWIWPDEEPPDDIYSECLTRTMEANGVVFMTYTALKGKTLLTERLMNEDLPSRGVVYMDWNEAEHLTKQMRDEMWSSWPVHERETRAYGKPMMGEGAIFRTPEDQIIEQPIEAVPQSWFKIWGLDIGIGHPFGAALLLHDRDADIVHVHHTVRMAEALPLMHAAAMKPIGSMVPVAWPKDAGDRDPGSGQPIIRLYKAAGLLTLGEHARWEDGSVSTWAGITEWDERERTGRLKCSALCKDWFEERRGYHTKRTKAGNIEIVKIRDDVLSATRIGLMAKRFAKAVPLGGGSNRMTGNTAQQYAIGTANHPGGEFDLFTGA